MSSLLSSSMNFTTTTIIMDLIATKGDDLFNLPLHYFDFILDIPPGSLSALERACDLDQEGEHDANTVATWEGKTSAQLGCLTENYLYEYAEPIDARAYLLSKIYHPDETLSLMTTKTSNTIVNFFSMLHSSPVTSYKLQSR